MEKVWLSWLSSGIKFHILGTFSEVKKCRHRKTGKLYAVKISERSGTNNPGMRDDEIQILVNFGQHPNIITVKVSN